MPLGTEVDLGGGYIVLDRDHWATASSISDAPSLVTHAADAVAVHQCHERDSDVIFTLLLTLHVK